MRCTIGISLALDDRGRWRTGREYHYLDGAYARAVAETGAIPVYLPIQPDASSALEPLDALLLPGGDDLLPPAPYPEHVHFDPVPAPQLAFDRALLRAALEAELPVLCICYGMQLLALEHGGGLVYDIGTDLPEAGCHRLPEPHARHPIAIERRSELARILGAESDSVNSLHHQAVADPGHGLQVCARATDGVVEAIEREGPGFCLGVQWHPEQLASPSSRALFAAFAAAARDARALRQRRACSGAGGP